MAKRRKSYGGTSKQHRRAAAQGVSALRSRVKNIDTYITDARTRSDCINLFQAIAGVENIAGRYAAHRGSAKQKGAGEPYSAIYPRIARIKKRFVARCVLSPIREDD